MPVRSAHDPIEDGHHVGAGGHRVDGDLRARAITLGQIADVLEARGKLDEALRLWREALAVFEQLGAPDLIAVARDRLARLQAR